MREKELQSRAERELTLKGRRPKALSDLRKKDDLHPALLGQRLQSSAERLTVDLDVVFCRFGTWGRADQSGRAPGCNEKTPQYRSRRLEFHDARRPVSIAARNAGKGLIENMLESLAVGGHISMVFGLITRKIKREPERRIPSAPEMV
jgi:hypothetical protein